MVDVDVYDVPYTIAVPATCVDLGGPPDFVIIGLLLLSSCVVCVLTSLDSYLFATLLFAVDDALYNF